MPRVIICSVCNESRVHEGNGMCKPCYRKDYYAKNKEREAIKKKEWNLANPEKVKARRNAWSKTEKGRLYAKKRYDNYTRERRDELNAGARRRLRENKERYSEYSKKWRKNNPAKHNAKEARRRSRKLNAMPSWHNEFDDFVIGEAFELAKLREKVTGIKWHVDHVVPLQGVNVCGLHCAANIQLLTAAENIRKSNNF